MCIHFYCSYFDVDEDVAVVVVVVVVFADGAGSIRPYHDGSGGGGNVIIGFCETFFILNDEDVL